MKLKLWQIATLSCGGVFVACLACSAIGLVATVMFPASTPAVSQGRAGQPTPAAALAQPPVKANPPAGAPTAAPTIALPPTWTPAPTPTAPIPTLTPVVVQITPVSAPLAGAAACIPANPRETGLVVEVIDGDTIDVQIDGAVKRVRYIGIDTPENTSQVDPFGPEATLRNVQLVAGQQVTLVRDVSETDKYDRLLRYVLVGDTFVNYELARQGYASAVSYPPDVACLDTFRQAESQARESALGLWALTAAQPQPTTPPASAPTQPPRGGAGNCDPSYPDVCIPPAPPDLNCGDVPYSRFRVLPPDPHNFDGDGNGIGCEEP